jgi:15-cis-phytoene synthase
MTLATNWERQLIEKATIAPAHELIAPLFAYGDDVMEHAYQYCAQITQTHSKTFYLTSGLLGNDERKAARALYAFCRISDDLADEESGDRLARLEAWKRRSLAKHPHPDDLVSLAWADTRARYGIPMEYAEQLLEGVAQDLTKTRYANFDELAHYCYAVASTVGLMTIHIIGFSGPEAIPYAVKLGVALQLTNILRDVGEDWQNGRVYLPQDELAAFGLSNEDIDRGQVTKNWRDFMRFQIERNRQLYAEAMPGIAMLGQQGQFAIAASAELYQAILEAIETNDYNVFTKRAHLSSSEKLKRLPGIWWRARSENRIM